MKGNEHYRMNPQEQKLAHALRPFGWTCTASFWQEYYSNPWVFNLANAVERLTDQIDEMKVQVNPTREMS